MADGQMDGCSIHIHSQETSCLSCKDLSVSKRLVSVSQWKGETEGRKKTVWTSQQEPPVQNGHWREKKRDISSLGVKMADRWTAAGRKLVCASFTNLLALFHGKIPDSSLSLSVCLLFMHLHTTWYSTFVVASSSHNRQVNLWMGNF